MQQLKQLKVLYDNPLYNAAMTFRQPLPVGLVITLLSAARRCAGSRATATRAIVLASHLLKRFPRTDSPPAEEFSAMTFATN